MFGAPPRQEGGRNVGQLLAAGKSDVIGSLGENQGSEEVVSSGEWGDGAGAGQGGGGQAGSPPGSQGIDSTPQTWGAQLGAGESPGPWGLLVTGQLCLVPSRFPTTCLYSIMHGHPGSRMHISDTLEARVVRNRLF